MKEKTDIVPGLLETIQADFEKEYKESKQVKRLLGQIEKGATYKEVNEYAITCGEALSNAFSKNITEDILPNGKMHPNIAERILTPTLKHNYDLVAKATTKVQNNLNKNAGIGLKAIKPPFNKDRIEGLKSKTSSYEKYSQAKGLMEEAPVNYSQSIVDDSIKSNAEFHHKAGLTPQIERTSTGKCCDWCNELVGTYKYPEAPKDIYRRHRHCRCTVDYDPGNGGKKDVWKGKNSKYAGLTKKQIEKEKNKEKTLAKLQSEKKNKRQKIGTQESKRDIINKKEETAEKFNNTKPAPFARAVEEAKGDVDPAKKWRVSAYKAEHYAGSKLHVTPKGSTVAVDKTGDIISVCRTKADTVTGSELLEKAVQNGGNKMDSYSGNHNFYIKNGFKPESWCKWVDKYAPEDWNDRYEREPIIFYRYTGNENTTSLYDFVNKTKPSLDYETAQKVRDERLKE